MTSIILLSVFGIVNLFVGFLKSKKILLPLALLFLIVVFGVNLLAWNNTQTYFNNMLTIDNYAVAFTGIMVLTTLLILPFSQSYIDAEDENLAEYYSLLLFSLVGAIMMVAYENLIMLFIGIEILSIAMYVLAGSNKRSLRSNEAALKYFLMGSFFTGVLLFGIVLIYGATGTFDITEIGAANVMADGTTNTMFTMGLLLLVIGISFKIAAAPFHFWTPDVYEGTPTFFTTFMATVVKTAGVAAFYKLMNAAFEGSFTAWFPTIIAITVLTLVVGNIGAVIQPSVKRMLAYSSISHAGYLLMTLVAFNDLSENAIFFYSLSYALASVMSFGILKLVEDAREGNHSFAAFNGLGKTNPLLAFVMTVSMLSLGGIPLTAGFFGKLFVFSAVIETGNLMWLVVLAVVLAAIGIYYYIKVVIAMYMQPAGENTKVPVSGFATLVLIICAALTVLLGLVPGLVSNML
ncbi:NADH-quinone oxidoreductase subunit N [Pontibacter sp. BT310]|uniref:NADH-quinone oxidoreductase subunit N n=1 Tax=Pontibacter populi TaxID=890055 RepID=A0ABS6XEF2_9BACT|nr:MULTISPECIES: NADH-quinone oxidoreductase subunit N [Pontibacter]MBJ6119504.1 NADH-quinone oxidoreductase subunit N [Pontibacter sp. BT310]MBR0571932.1 NADH-quinone oxidoreductase subunit N [Microvirga sp. STS03]MBW3366358.1 NADH-quinone oxidoreductase subunit N [Pontibacter populi]